MKVLITGWSGTGKTTLAAELHHRGLNAFDADRLPGLAAWCLKGTDVPDPQRSHGDYSPEKYEWNWNGDMLRKLLGENDDIYLCGNANNAPSFYKLFDQLLLLDVPEAEQRRRMMSRVEHAYGQDMAIQDIVIEQQAELVRNIGQLGLLRIDASGNAKDVADNVVAAL